MLKIKLENYDKAVELLDVLPDRLQRKVLIKMLRKSAKPVVSAARSMASPISKRVAKSIKAFEPKRKSDAVLFVGPKRSSNRDADPWFAHMIEGGAKGEGRFTVKKTKLRSHLNDGKQIFRFINAKRKGLQRYRSDQPARPFMAPAVDSQRDNANSIFVNDLNSILQSEIEKLK